MQCDEYLIKQIEELKKQLHEQQIEYDQKIEKLQRELIEIKEKSIADKYELKSIVKEGMYEAIEKFEEKQDEKLKPMKEEIHAMKNDIKELQTEKINKFNLITKAAITTIVSTTVGWILTSLVTNFIFIKR